LEVGSISNNNTSTTTDSSSSSSFIDDVASAASVAADMQSAIDALAKRERVALAISALAQLVARAAAEERKQLEATLALHAAAEPVPVTSVVVPTADEDSFSVALVEFVDVFADASRAVALYTPPLDFFNWEANVMMVGATVDVCLGI
jgi:hypothetical protein